MQPGPFTTYESRILLIDAHNEQGGRLVEQLNHAGFKTDFAVSWTAAHAALRANCYQSCVVIAELDQLADLDHLAELRRMAPRVWIIVLSDFPPENTRARAHRQGIDAVISAPFSMEELTSRLAALSVRTRPAF
jgi:DNA-binding response OmpR family regulator